MEGVGKGGSKWDGDGQDPAVWGRGRHIGRAGGYILPPTNSSRQHSDPETQASDLVGR